MAAVTDRSKGARLADAAIYGALGIYTLACVFPIVVLVIQSFASTSEIIPRRWSLDAYRYIASTPTLFRGMAVSVYVATLGTMISLLFTALMAYALAERGLPGRRLFQYLVIVTMLFNGGMIPTYLVVRATGLLNKLWAIMIPNAINAFNMIVMRNFFQRIPEELKESARIDGAHEMRILLQIIAPLSLPSLAAIGLFYAVGKWNLYFEALLYIQTNRLWPVQVTLRQIIVSVSGTLGGDARILDDANQTLIDSSVRAACIIVASLPVMMLYPFLQRHFAKGLLLGSVKG